MVLVSLSVSISKSGWVDTFNDGRVDGIGDGTTAVTLGKDDLEAVAETFNWDALTDPDSGMNQTYLP